MDRISEADIAQARIDPRVKQALLTKALEQLLATLQRMQHDPAHLDPESLRQVRVGAMMAVKVADLIRDLEEQTHLVGSASQVA
jgi:type VI protein secretion system component VasF